MNKMDQAISALDNLANNDDWTADGMRLYAKDALDFLRSSPADDLTSKLLDVRKEIVIGNNAIAIDLLDECIAMSSPAKEKPKPTEEQLQAQLDRLRANNPMWREYEELGAFLMRPIDDLTEAEQARYDELLIILKDA